MANIINPQSDFDARLSRIEGEIEQINRHIDALHKRIDSVERRLDNLEKGQRWIVGLLFTQILAIFGATVTILLSLP